MHHHTGKPSALFLTRLCWSWQTYSSNTLLTLPTVSATHQVGSSARWPASAPSWLDKPDERRDFPHGPLEVLNLSGLSLRVATFEPGWRWSESVRPIAGTDSCQVHHNGFYVSGRMRVRMDDGSEAEVTQGDVFVIPPGHDAWVVGDEALVAYDFVGGAAEYARAMGG